MSEKEKENKTPTQTKEAKEWYVGEIPTQVEKVIALKDGEIKLDHHEALALILNKLEKIENALLG